MVYSKEVIIDYSESDQYGRIIGHVLLQGLDANEEMVRRGAAWVYRDYLKDKSLLDVEAEARNAKRGLWAQPEAQQTPPWEWRKASKAASASKASQPVKKYSPSVEPIRSCCKVCSKGKPCGDSCISRSKTCHKGIGCAC